MYFTECESLAERHRDLAEVIQQIDAQLQQMGTAEVIRAEDVASFLGVDPNRVTSVFEMLAQDGVLLGEEMIECPHCRMPVLRSEYEGMRDEEGEYRCTECDRPLTGTAAPVIMTYRRGERWKVDEQVSRVSDVFPGGVKTEGVIGPAQSYPKDARIFQKQGATWLAGYADAMLAEKRRREEAGE